ncbi:MAG: GGDEF domain-containing protein, partial [Actinobacteria bacterium]|nr:GGDEF domain-containing protein [Actinomycetota bacterium]
AAIFAVCGAFVVDGELRREVSLFRIAVLPIVIGLSFLDAPLVLLLQLVAGSLVAALTSRRMAKEFIATLAFVTLGTALLSFAVPPALERRWSDPITWLVVAGSAVAIDALTSLLDARLRSSRRRSRRCPRRSETVVGALQVVVQTAVAFALVALVGARQHAAVLMFVASVGAFAVVRRSLAVAVRNRSLARLNGLARTLATSVSETSALRELLLETVAATDARRAWVIMVRETISARYECVDGELVEAPLSEFDYLLTRSIDDGQSLLLDPTGGSVPVSLRKALLAQELPELIVAALNGPRSNRLILVVSDRGDEYGRFDSDDVRLVEAIAQHGQLAVANVDLFDQIRQKAAEQEYLATHDQLTGLPNRTMMQTALGEALQDRRPTAVLLLDLDRFREINDTLGHTYGDLVVMEVSRRLSRLADFDEFVARLGGDEWAIISRPRTPADPAAIAAAAIVTAQRMVQALREPFHINDVDIDIRGSVGVAVAGPEAPDPVTLLRHADAAMYLAKRAKHHVELYHHERDHHSPR